MSWAERAQAIVTDGNPMLALLVAAAAGFVSFASPCVLPLVPGYLSYMSGVSGQDVEQRGDRAAGRVVAGAALFVLGFALVFVALGAALGALTSWLVLNRGVVTRVAGVLVIVMGLFLAGVIKPGFLYRERRLRADKVPGGLAGALPLGMVFGLGWTLNQYESSAPPAGSVGTPYIEQSGLRATMYLTGDGFYSTLFPAGITVTPFFSNGSPYTRRTVMASFACSIVRCTSTCITSTQYRRLSTIKRRTTG